MNPTAENAAFRFESHRVTKLLFSEPATNQVNLAIEFALSGEYNPTDATYKLILRVLAKYGEKQDKVLCDVTTNGYFKFPEKTTLNQFPEYFYPNSIAILFPYVRAFLTTLTSVGNIKPLILPTFNLGALASPLKQNTIVVG